MKTYNMEVQELKNKGEKALNLLIKLRAYYEENPNAASFFSGGNDIGFLISDLKQALQPFEVKQ